MTEKYQYRNIELYENNISKDKEPFLLSWLIVFILSTKNKFPKSTKSIYISPGELIQLLHARTKKIFYLF